VWIPLSLTKWSPGVRVNRIGYYYLIFRRVTNPIFITSFVPMGDIFFTADLADVVRTYRRKTLPPSYSKEDLNTVVENVKSGWMTLYRASKLYEITKAI